MAWKIEFLENVEKTLKNLPKTVQKRIITVLTDISTLEDPRERGKGLTGNLKGLWRYRVGDYRIICRIKNNVLTVYVIDIGHRSEIYKN